MKYMPGKTNPRDYQSRHPLPLGQYTTKEINDMVIDQDDDLCISKIVTDDLPDAVTLKMIQQATKQDPTPLPDRPWQRVDMDLWGPMPRCQTGIFVSDHR